MTTFVALLRAVNVGGTGKLPMAHLVTMAEAAGFERVRTYIASGNLVFESASSASEVAEALERALAAYAGKPVGVLVRTAAEMEAVLSANPFPEAAPNRTVAIFLDAPPPADFLDHVVAPGGEEVRGGVRELYVHYAGGMGTSKLKLPAAKAGTARNMNTVARLVAMTRDDRASSTSAVHGAGAVDARGTSASASSGPARSTRTRYVVAASTSRKKPK